jgi:hypothetical protein
MNDDYKTSLSIHNPVQDLTWWDQNYGMLLICISYTIYFLIIKVHKQIADGQNMKNIESNLILL